MGVGRGGWGGRALPELKNTLYIFLFDGRKRCTSCPKEGEGEGGRRGNSGNARKKTFFFSGGVPLCTSTSALQREIFDKRPNLEHHKEICPAAMRGQNEEMIEA